MIGKAVHVRSTPSLGCLSVEQQLPAVGTLLIRQLIHHGLLGDNSGRLGALFALPQLISSASTHQSRTYSDCNPLYLHLYFFFSFDDKLR